MKVKLKDICEVKNGYAFKSDEYVNSGIRVIRITNVQKGFVEDENPQFYPVDKIDDLAEYMLNKDDLLISLTGNVGRVAILGEEFLPAALNQRVGCLRVLNSVKTKYLFYYLLSKRFEDDCIKYSKGIAQKNMSTEWLKEYELNIVAIEEQDRIVQILGTLQNTIFKYNKLLKNLDTLIKARFVEMFGLKFNKQNALLKDIANFTIGLTYKPENITNEGTIVLRSGNIQNNDLQLKEDIVRVSNIVIPDNKYIRENDILMCSRNGSARLVGKSCLIKKPIEKMSFGAFMTVIRSDYPFFLQGFFTSEYFVRQLTNVATTSVNQITTYMLNDYKTIVPTIEEEKQFATFVHHIDKLKFDVQKSLEKAQTLFDSLMQEYFG